LPAPLDDAKRQAIITDIKAGKPRNQIARDHSVSGSTVTRTAKTAGITKPFDRSKTENATRAMQSDAAAERAYQIQAYNEDFRKLRERAWSEYTQAVGSGSPVLVTTKLPPLRDQQAAYTSMAICTDKAEKLRQLDTGSGPDHAKSMLGKLMAGLAEAFGDETDEGDG